MIGSQSSDIYHSTIGTIIWPQDGKIQSPDRTQDQENTVPRLVFQVFIYFAASLVIYITRMALFSKDRIHHVCSLIPSNFSKWHKFKSLLSLTSFSLLSFLPSCLPFLLLLSPFLPFASIFPI